MREIKFRAWDEELNEMCEVYGLDKIYVRYISKPNTEEDSMYESAIKNVVLMQYTGRKDKNGKEIYEGDIVKHSNGIKKVFYDDESYSFQMGLSEYVYDQEDGIYDGIQVIGNIYENPELLIDTH